MIELREFNELMRFYSKVCPKSAPDFEDKRVLYFWYDEFKNYETSDFIDLMGEACKTRIFFPSIVEVKQLAGNSGEITNETRARATAAKIIATVKKLGSSRDQKRINEEIGELGQAVVALIGGWQSLCDELTNENLSTKEAQYRELAKGAIEIHNSGGGSSYLDLPAPRQKIGDALTVLGEGDLAGILPMRKPDRD